MQVVKNLSKKMLLPAVFAAAFASPAMATDQYNDLARVISATPQVERVNVPRQECRTEYQQQQSYRQGGNTNLTGAIIGGVAGGLLGNTVGRGSGRTAAAAVGAGVGALVGNNIGNNYNNNHYRGTRTVPVESCYQVDNWQSVTTGYLVTYEYNGRNYTTVTNNHPGRYIDVNVAVAPQRQAVTQINYDDSSRWNNSRWDDDGYRKHRKNRHHREHY